MKLKVLIVIFNAILLTIFFTVFSFSFFTTGTEFIGNFFKNYWGFIFFFLFFLAGTNIFFIRNWKLITALEAEDWRTLALYLETEIFQKHHLTAKKVRLLSEVGILLGDFKTLERLEQLLEERNPKYIRIFATRFAAAKLLSNNYQELAEFSARMTALPDAVSPWMHFYDAFSAQMLKQYPEAAKKFSLLLKKKQPPLIRLLSIYLIGCGLYTYLDIGKEEAENCIETEKIELRKCSFPDWEKHNMKEKQEIHILVLTKVIDEAVAWLFKEDNEPSASGAEQQKA